MKKPFPLFFLFMIVLVACKTPTDPVEENVDYDQYDYSLSQLILGVGFPPSADEEQRDFSISHMDELGVDWYRINQDWAYREPDNDDFQWGPLSNRLQQFSSSGKKILLTLDIKNLPLWWIDLATDTERLTEFQEFCSQLLMNFGDQIEILQFGNEWNHELEDFLPGTDKASLFIEMTNILAQEIASLPEGSRPQHALGSLAIGALQLVSYEAGSIDNIYYDGVPLYTDEELLTLTATSSEDLAFIENILENTSFEIMDLHFYDDYWNWPTYLEDMKSLLTNAGHDIDSLEFIAGEFGGPHPSMESHDAETNVHRLINYAKTLDELEITKAFFFKLFESPGQYVVHADSFLVDENQVPDARYEAFRRLDMN